MVADIRSSLSMYGMANGNVGNQYFVNHNFGRYSIQICFKSSCLIVRLQLNYSADTYMYVCVCARARAYVWWVVFQVLFNHMTHSAIPAKTDSIWKWFVVTDIVLKDQLIVYDNDLQRIGWKPFNCKYLESLFCLCEC